MQGKEPMWQSKTPNVYKVKGYRKKKGILNCTCEMRRAKTRRQHKPDLLNHDFLHYCHLPNLLNSTAIFLSNNLRNIITPFVAISWVTAIIIVGGSMIVIPPINAQENLTSSSQSQNATTTTSTTVAAEERTYILVFGHRTVGNIDNSTKIVSSIAGNNSAKIQEEFLEEISLAPSQELEEQISGIVNDATNGSPCSGVPLTTEDGENVSVDCISSGNTVIWYIHPAQ